MFWVISCRPPMKAGSWTAMANPCYGCRTYIEDGVLTIPCLQYQKTPPLIPFHLILASSSMAQSGPLFGITMVLTLKVCLSSWFTLARWCTMYITHTVSYITICRNHVRRGFGLDPSKSTYRKCVLNTIRYSSVRATYRINWRVCSTKND
jgi:hypothetical protein